MRNDQRFEIQRAFDLLPHVVGASWAVTWFRLNGVRKPTKEQYYDKVIEYFEKLNPLVEAYKNNENLQDISKYITYRMEKETSDIKNGKNKEIEKRYDRYIDYG